MLGHIREVRLGDHRDLFDVLLTIPNEAEVGDHRAEIVPARKRWHADIADINAGESDDVVTIP